MPRAIGINHVALEVGDIEAAVELYRGLFGFPLRGQVPGAAFLDMGDQFIALAEGGRQAPDEKRHFGLVVDSLDTARRALETAGAEILTGRGLDFRDPWGNHVQLVEYGDIQFAKTQSVLEAMRLSDLEKSEAARAELREKGFMGGHH